MIQYYFQAWYSLIYVICEHVYEIRHEIIGRDLLKVEDDRSDIVHDFLDGHGCSNDFYGCICGGSKRGSNSSG